MKHTIVLWAEKEKGYPRRNYRASAKLLKREMRKQKVKRGFIKKRYRIQEISKQNLVYWRFEAQIDCRTIENKLNKGSKKQEQEAKEINPYELSIKPTKSARNKYILKREEILLKEKSFVAKCDTCDATGEIECKICKGLGNHVCTVCSGAKHANCRFCRGLGYREVRQVVQNKNRSSKPEYVNEECDSCGGTGVEFCDFCNEYGIMACRTCQETGVTKCNSCQGLKYAEYTPVLLRETKDYSSYHSVFTDCWIKKYRVFLRGLTENIKGVMPKVLFELRKDGTLIDVEECQAYMQEHFKEYPDLNYFENPHRGLVHLVYQKATLYQIPLVRIKFEWEGNECELLYDENNKKCILDHTYPFYHGTF